MISISVIVDVNATADDVCSEIFSVEKWSSFKGYGIIPAIAQATKESGTESHVGTIFSVENTDGSTHTETVESFEPGKALVLRLDNFSAPLKYLASHFTERWVFAEQSPNCRITRTLELFPHNLIAEIPLRLISWFLRKALLRHTKEIAPPVA